MAYIGACDQIQDKRRQLKKALGKKKEGRKEGRKENREGRRKEGKKNCSVASRIGKAQKYPDLLHYNINIFFNPRLLRQ